MHHMHSLCWRCHNEYNFTLTVGGRGVRQEKCDNWQTIVRAYSSRLCWHFFLSVFKMCFSHNVQKKTHISCAIYIFLNTTCVSPDLISIYWFCFTLYNTLFISEQALVTLITKFQLHTHHESGLYSFLTVTLCFWKVKLAFCKYINM